jgi:hypothetical protein
VVVAFLFDARKSLVALELAGLSVGPYFAIEVTPYFL